MDFELILKELINDKLLQLNEFLSICLQSCIIGKKMIRFNKNLQKILVCELFISDERFLA